MDGNMIHKYFLFIYFGLLCFWSGEKISFADNSVHESAILLKKFDHDRHNLKVFKKDSFLCSKCHHFTVDPKTLEAFPEERLSALTFKLPAQMMCHQCHKSDSIENKSAPKECVNCHDSRDKVAKVIPLNHKSNAWKSSHSMEARIEGNKCQNCHYEAQCVKCHSHRNDVKPENHPRNFRFTHSMEARFQPQKCDTCHTKSYCTQCHLKGK